MGRPKGYRASDKERALLALLARKHWAERSREERELVQLKQKLGALRMWRMRTEEERRRIGRAIAEGKRKAKKERKDED